MSVLSPLRCSKVDHAVIKRPIGIGKTNSKRAGAGLYQIRKARMKKVIALNSTKVFRSAG